MEFTPISIRKKTKSHKGKDGKVKKYTYYEAVTTVMAAKEHWRETGSGKTRIEAKNALMEKINRSEEKLTSVEVKAETLAIALKHFAEYLLREGKWAESTYSRNARIIEHQVETYLIGLKPPKEVTHEDVLSYLEQLRGYGYSKSTQDKAYSLLQLYFNYIYKDNRGNNPCYGIKIGYEPKLSRDNVLSSEEVKKVFRVCDEMGGNADLIKFAFMTYERPGEVRVLRFSDWDSKAQTVKINRTMTQDKEGHATISEEGKTKTKTSTREIKLSQLANEIIKKRYNEKWNKDKKRPGKAYIWPQKRDKTKPMDYNTMRRLFKKVLEAAGVDKNVTLHGLRHSGITFYGKDRDQFLTISKNAGHSRPSITEDIYSHVLDEHKEQAAKSADRLNEELGKQ